MELAKIRRPISATEPRNEADRKLAAAILGEDGSDDEGCPMPVRVPAEPGTASEQLQDAELDREQPERAGARATPASSSGSPGERSWPPSVVVPPLMLPEAGVSNVPMAAARTASGTGVTTLEEGLGVAVAALAARIAELENCLELDPRAPRNATTDAAHDAGGVESAAAMVLADEQEGGRQLPDQPAGGEGGRGDKDDSAPAPSVWVT